MSGGQQSSPWPPFSDVIEGVGRLPQGFADTDGKAETPPFDEIAAVLSQLVAAVTI
jgi:hypothetical protein